MTQPSACGAQGKKQPEFQQVLASRKISLHYDVEDFRKDLQTLRELGAR